MKTIIRTLPPNLKERPFDFYVASVLFLVGLYGIFDERFPERFQQPVTSIFINVISIYLMAASSLIISSLLCKKQERPVYAYMSEFFGWMLICAASISTSLLYIASAALYTGFSFVWTIWLLIWIGMAGASLIRTYDLYIITRRNR